MPLRINFQSHLGGGDPTTLGSDNNYFRKGLTAALVGASGVPRLVSKTPIFGESYSSCLFSGLFKDNFQFMYVIWNDIL